MLFRYAYFVLGLTLSLAILPGCKRTTREAETDANVRAALVSEGCKVVRKDRRVFHVRCGDAGEESAINLENFEGLVQGVPAAEQRRAEAIKFVRRLMSAPMLPDTAPLEKLVLVIRQQNYVQVTAERMGTDVEPMVSFPFPGDLVVIAAVDTPGSTEMVPVSALGRWKVDEATVYSRAIENFDAHPLPAERIEPDESDVAVYRLATADDENEASRLLSPKTRASMEKVLGGRAVFSIPDRRQLLAARADDVRSVVALRALTAMYSEGPLRISGDLFEVDGHGKLRVVR